ncbi:FAD-linked oxidoreductase [Gonapodya prolifera JEL478]|uniref:Proline dehydrogenase n=1 Tax=Gonapodya prolifera (strain JEL478) TaxID=1344416 RepID=A0A139A1I0_GONPJ|nr:FAD-linked oxidoreductase [Gonapodya prolifera JEL478]|eukprot:KXS10612.1 FAD-linked oxidoreductase [Gonapodya prolifera JEL478]
MPLPTLAAVHPAVLASALPQSPLSESLIRTVQRSRSLLPYQARGRALLGTVHTRPFSSSSHVCKPQVANTSARRPAPPPSAPWPRTATGSLVQPSSAALKSSTTGSSTHGLGDGSPLPPASGPQSNAVTTHPSPFSDPEVVSAALSHKPTSSLLLSYAVFGMCLFKPLVEHADTLLDLSSKFKLTDVLAKETIRATFFKQFCGGETDAEVEASISTLRAKNVRAILDLAYEADVESEEESSAGASGGNGVSTAPLVTEDSPIFNATEGTIDVAGRVGEGFVAIKVTAFASPTSLSRLSNLLRAARSSFLRYADSRGIIRTRERAVECLEELLGGGVKGASGRRAEELVRVFDVVRERELQTGRGEMDWVDFATAISPTNPAARTLLTSLRPPSLPPRTPSGEPITPGDPDYSLPLPGDWAHLDQAVHLCSILVDRAVARGVKVAIDAEQTVSQPAIDHVAQVLMARYNGRFADGGSPGEGVHVYNTVQMYLLDGLPRLREELERSGREGYSYGVKVVRGAYMQTERERAKELAIPDPIQPTLEATHASFDAGIALVLDSFAAGRTDLSIVIATHNADSITKAMDRMQELGIPPGSTVVNFAQLYGMMDIHTLTLAQLGYRAHKYVPYGPVDVCIPYLLRRAQENSAVLGGATRELKAIGGEVGRRVARVGGGWA